MRNYRTKIKNKNTEIYTKLQGGVVGVVRDKRSTEYNLCSGTRARDVIMSDFY
jgi:hypothetical protein